MKLESRIEKLEREITGIHARNRKVERDKAWEVSNFRVFILGFFLYTIIYIFLEYIRTPNAFLAAFVPPAGFIMSVQSLPILKRWWIRRRFGKDIDGKSG